MPSLWRSNYILYIIEVCSNKGAKFVESFLIIISYIIPFAILYFVIVTAVKRGIDQSEAGRIIIENKVRNKEQEKK